MTEDEEPPGNPKRRKIAVLIRDTSFYSLIEIPTYTSCNIQLKAQSSLSCYTSFQIDSEKINGISLDETLAIYQPMIDEEAQNTLKKMKKRVVNLSIIFILFYLMMVGTMFAITSQYQDKVVANMINLTNQHLHTLEEETT
jgi:hypothetical protein